MQAIKRVGVFLIILCILLGSVSCGKNSKEEKLGLNSDNVFEPSSSYYTYLKYNESDFIKLDINTKKSQNAFIANNLSGENITNDALINYYFNGTLFLVKCSGIVKESEIMNTTTTTTTTTTTSTATTNKKKKSKAAQKTIKLTTKPTSSASMVTTEVSTTESSSQSSKMNQTIKIGNCTNEYRVENSSKIVFVKNSLSCKYSLEFCISQEQNDSTINQIPTLLDSDDDLKNIFSMFTITSVSDTEIPKNAEEYLYDVKLKKILNKKINSDIKISEMSKLNIVKDKENSFYNFASLVYFTSIPLENNKGNIDVSYTYNALEFNDDETMEYVLKKKYKQKKLKLVSKEINGLNVSLIKVDDTNYLPLFILDCDNSKIAFTWNHSSLVNNEFLDVSENSLASEEKISKNMSIIFN